LSSPWVVERVPPPLYAPDFPLIPEAFRPPQILTPERKLESKNIFKIFILFDREGIVRCCITKFGISLAEINLQSHTKLH
jgi:hypothetical protein